MNDDERTCTTCGNPVVVCFAYSGGEVVDLIDVMHAEQGTHDHEPWTDVSDVL